MQRGWVGAVGAAMLVAVGCGGEQGEGAEASGPGPWVSTSGAPLGAAPELRVLEATTDRTVVEANLPGFHAVESALFLGQQELSIPGGSTRVEVGSPALPTVSRWLAVPAGAELTVEVLEQRSSRLAGWSVRPVQPQLKRGAQQAPAPVVDAERYATDAFWPASPAAVPETAQLRQLGLARLQVTPLRLNPVSGELEVFTYLRLALHHPAPGGWRGPISRDSEPFERLYASTLLAVDALNAPRRTAGLQARMLVIAADRFLADVEPLVQWKRRRGIDVEVLAASAAGSTPAQIKAAIRRAYDDVSRPPLTYVLLVGNAEEIPANRGAGGCASDSLYAMLAGNDIIADVLIGRIAADTVAQAELQIAKILAHEMQPPRGVDGRFLGHAAGISSSEGWPVNDDTRADKVREALLGAGYAVVDRLYHGLGAASPETINSRLDNGRGLVTYFGHGSGVSWASTNGRQYGVAEVEALANARKLPVIVDISCSNGNHVGSEQCLAEAFVQQGSLAEPTGAVAMFSSSTPTSWDPSGDLGEGVAYALAGDSEAVLGQVVLGGLLYMQQQHSAADAKEVWHQFNLFGDPSLVLWSAPPLEPQVTHPAELAAGEALRVMVGACEGPACRPRPGATVVVLEGEVVLAVAESDAAGAAELEVEAGAGVELELWVTAAGVAPYSARLAVAAASCPSGACGDCAENCPPAPPGLAGKLLINEILADPPAGVDVNGDGDASVIGDEFVEIVSLAAETLDLGGVVITDRVHFEQGRARRVLAEGTLLEPGAALVLWGAEAPLGLNNYGDTVYLLANGEVIDRVAYGTAAAHDDSLTRAVDGDPQAAWVRHSSLPPGLAYSPGLRHDGSPF